MSDNLPPLQHHLKNFIDCLPGSEKQEVTEAIQLYARAAIEADRVSRDVPTGWITDWPKGSGGTAPVYTHGAEKPNHGKELNAVLNSYPVFAASPQPQQSGAPASASVAIDYRQAVELVEMFGGEPAEVRLIHGDGHSGPGLYAYYDELPEEGANFLGETDPDAEAPMRESVPMKAADEFELRRLIMEERATVRNLTRALGEAIDGPTFMGEPVLAASPQPQPVQPSEAEKFMDAAGLCRRCAAPVADAPIDMVLHCPACGMQHVDAPSPTDGQNLRMWSNPPHKSHLCRPEDGGCGHIWRPADVPTNGVAATKTNGKADSPVDEVKRPAELACGPDYKHMFLEAVQALANIDKLLGLPEDGCNDPQVTVSTLADFLAGAREAAQFRDHWVDAQYQSEPQPVRAQPLTCVECGGVLGHTRMCSKFSGYTNKAANQQKD